MSPIFIKSPEHFRKECEAASVGLPFCDDVRVLGEPVRVGGQTAPNRLVCQAMEGCDGNADGTPGELTRRKYRRLAKGGAGLIWAEATAVLPEARANPRQLHLTAQNLDQFKRFTEEIRETARRETGREPLLILQLTHSGRYARPNGAPEPLILYNNPLFETAGPIDKSRILSDGQLDRVSGAVAESAALAQRAGFSGVDIKCCHRYLFSESLSAHTREGKYGGSFENRTRLLLNSVRNAAENCGGGFLLTSRLNIYDGFPYPYGFGAAPGGGLTPDYEEPRRLAAELEKAGVCLLNISMGNPYVNPHVNRPYLKGGYVPPEHPLKGVARMLEGAREIGGAVPHIPVVCSGISYLGGVSPNVAAACIREGWFAMAGYGRLTLAYPDFAADIENGRFSPDKCCITCGKCTELMRAGGTPGCVVFDREVYLPLYREIVQSKLRADAARPGE